MPIWTSFFLFPNHALCVTENGYRADKAESVAPTGEYSRPGSCKQVEQKKHWHIDLGKSQLNIIFKLAIYSMYRKYVRKYVIVRSCNLAVRMKLWLV